MPGMELYGRGGGLSTRDARLLARTTSRSNLETQRREIAIDAEADVTAAKIEAATYTTGVGMNAVVRVAKALETLEQMAPTATGRLNLLADDHALGVAETLQQLRYRLRRI